MIKRNEDVNKLTEARERMRGGDGTAYVTNFVSETELNGKGRLFGKITLKPGCGIGYHVHEKDSELFYILKGNPIYSDNGTETELHAGDVTITPAGSGHAIRNPEGAAEDAEFVALIVYA